MSLEYFRKQANDLESETILADVIEYLEDAWYLSYLLICDSIATILIE